MAGFYKSVAYTEQLAVFMGCATGPRSLVTQMVWKHIKSNNLQNPKDKREIICDATLEALFHRKSVNMFKMTKLLSSVLPHCINISDGKSNIKTPCVPFLYIR